LKGSQTLPAAAAPPPALLAEITADLAAGEDLRALLDRFLGPLVQLARARAGSVRMLSADCTRFELVSTLGLPTPLDQAEQHADRHCGFCGRSADQGQAVWTRELHGCAARTGDNFFGGTCQGALAVPLRHGPRVLGVYNLFFEGDAEPDAAVLALLRSVGDLLGLALEKHRLEAENLRAAVAHERQLMAAEVHDALAQNLTFVKLRLPLLRDAIEAGQPESAGAYLADIDETLADAHGSLRQIITQFRTGIDPRGLAPALAALGGRFTQRTGIPLELDDGLCALRLPQADQVEVFHIVQEALANMERHAHARHGWLTLQRAPGRIEIRVEDDGVGTGGTEARTDVDRAHHGLDIMRERAQRLGGVLTVGPRPGGGTQVRCSLPAREEA
jgi:two-component system, NarL family, nitrate/nitrite sensor histidine kinase NarX